MLASLWVAVTLLVLLTVLPVLRHDRWWIRGLDFPRLQLALLALLLVLLPWWLPPSDAGHSWAMALISAACFAYHAWWILPYTRLHPKEVRGVGSLSESDRANRIAIMTANVLTPNRQAQRLLSLVKEHQPDLLVTLESDRWWQQQLDVLETDYAYTIKCPLDNLYGMHVYSRYPLENVAIQFLVEDDVPSMHAEVVLPSGERIVVHCLHPAPPSPTENETSSERDAELLVVGRSVAESDSPVIVTGDLNDVAWSATTRLFRKISGLLDPRIGRGMCNSFHAKVPLLRWPLDHLFHSEHFVLENLRRLPAFGSDHFPVLVRLVYRPNARPQEGLDADREDRQWAREKMAEESVTPGEVHRPEVAMPK
ncbi:MULTISPECIES: endonuclease/exonuclease/phosphatase family protein [unclassified Marinimicrobium]|jgi:endonuclease/exonuclease/phosphatase (EEP) superfamily protein YafD|uniref:endonuclease/exonuclease/phosphatase family protein n=1 Tax=Marinimicrobium TaxID=359337 RepID=UPI00257E1CE6|nr:MULTISPECIES: endonuclease/exonuclease/phosphatase family protein [unclassified Marinimicrobium]